MTELPAPHEKPPTELSLGAKKILLEAAQLYLIEFHSPGAFDDRGEDPADSFERAVKALWRQRVKSSDTEQFASDFAAIREMLTDEVAAEAIIDEQRAARREARAQQAQVEQVEVATTDPAISSPEATAVSVFSGFLRRRR